MLLKSLLMKNFRQFKGEQKILFASDGEQNVTMIMGDNGTGKTTLAQAFTWCLYGETSFEDKILLCKSTSATMSPTSVESVRAELVLEHCKIEYTIITEQHYQKDLNGALKPFGQLTRTIAFKKSNGSQDYIKQSDIDLRLKEILPKELAKYFFFDGERIGNMSKEIRRGRSQEFAGAVRSLLGLNAYTSALDHLGGRRKITVLKSYSNSYDDKSDSKISEYGHIIYACELEIESIDQRLTEIDAEIKIAQNKCSELSERILKNKDSETLATKKTELGSKINELEITKSAQVGKIKHFFYTHAPSFFAKKMMRDALDSLSKMDKLNKDVPNINDETIQYILAQKKCICGADVIAGNEAFKSLNDLLDYIPPKSVGNMIGEFVNSCEDKSRGVSFFFDDFSDKYKIFRQLGSDISDSNDEFMKLEARIGALEKVGRLQADLSRYENDILKLEDEKNIITLKKGGLENERKKAESSRSNLTSKDEANRKIKIYEAYAKYMFDTLNNEYSDEETRIRTQLQDTVNDLFRKIYNGGFSLSIDEKYNIQINVIDQAKDNAEDVETSSAQSISIIFAFISGVIKMARASQQAEEKMLISEPYPLVMDAPLSAFDKKRIKTVCEVLPAVAEQVIIFIKDTDGDLAEENLGHKIGKRYTFNKKNEFEVTID